jgi:hypothetical protein
MPQTLFPPASTGATSSEPSTNKKIKKVVSGTTVKASAQCRAVRTLVNENEEVRTQPEPVPLAGAVKNTLPTRNALMLPQPETDQTGQGLEAGGSILVEPSNGHGKQVAKKPQFSWHPLQPGGGWRWACWRTTSGDLAATWPRRRIEHV